MSKKNRDVFIKNIDIQTAKKMYFEKLSTLSTYEKVNVDKCLGRISYDAVYAKKSSPYYNASAMDGILVKAESTYGASEVDPIILKKDKDFIYVNTGNVIKEGYNAVIMIEDIVQVDEESVKIYKSAHPWQHIRPIGEDIIAHEMIIPSNHKIRAIDIGALLSGGIDTINVYKKPKVGIIPTGSEIVENVKEIQKGRIIDSNSRVFEGLIKEYGGIAKRYSPIEDKYSLIKESITKAVNENDVVLINAGSSAGSKDFTAEIISELGEVIVHGLAMKPGKPTILGVVKGKPVIGLPGYPVSSYLSFEVFVKPLIYKITGFTQYSNEKIEAVLSKRLVSSFKHKELVRVILGYVKDRYVATPLTRGAGVTMSLVKADGILSIPQNTEGIEAGNRVNIDAIKPLGQIKDNLVSIGSHDLILDYISDSINLTSGHVGSMGGIMAMKRGECHIAPIHLLDEKTGEYNLSYIKKYFPNKKMALIKGVKRQQGFIVKKGNPQKIKSFKDLLKNEVVYINRQRGAGTRVLLDYNLKNLKIDKNNIVGYNREAPTHMAVAIAVKMGTATTGLGIMSAAKAMELEFIPIRYEEYDFLVEYESINDYRIKNFIQTIKSEFFIEKVKSLGGYNIDKIGDVIILGE